MGVLQRFERRLEGLVEGVFARAFGGALQPVEVAAALQREAEDRKAIVGQGRVLVPNSYAVELSEADAGRLAEYETALRSELVAMVREHAQEQGWSFLGPVTVALEPVPDLAPGMFRVRSAVEAAPAEAPPAAEPGRGERLEFTAGPHTGQVTALTADVVVLGRGADADIRLTDLGVSRRHAELRRDGERRWLVDLGSSNGTTVNGRPVDRAALSDGDVVGLAATTLTYRAGP